MMLPANGPVAICASFAGESPPNVGGFSPHPENPIYPARRMAGPAQGDVSMMQAMMETRSPRSPFFAGPRSPVSILLGHRTLEREFARTLELGGLAGLVAGNTAKALDVHFREEEALLFPLISYIAALPGGAAIPEPEEISILSGRLEAAMPGLLEDHRVIRETLDDLAGAVRGADPGRLAAFAEMFHVHATTEEEIHFPAALLVGETLEGGNQAHLSLRRYYRRI